MASVIKGSKSEILCSISQDALINYVIKQCNLFYPDENPVSYTDIESVISITIDRLAHCFGKIVVPYFKLNGSTYFNHLHGDHYSMFLYILSNSCYTHTNDEATATKLFLLNKALFGIDAFYKIELPEVFLFVHPVGTVLGRGQYGNNFVVYQGVTVGATTDLVCACFGESTILYSNVSVIGNCKIGDNCVFGANTSIVNTDIESNKIIVGNYPAYRTLENKNNLIGHYFLPSNF